MEPNSKHMGDRRGRLLAAVQRVPFSNYDKLAFYYNRHRGQRLAQNVLPVLDRLLLSKLPRNARILDLCCGTGQIADALGGLGFRVTGVDGSRGQLRFARKNAKRARFLHADARSFRSDVFFDAAICAGDSLNHVMKLTDLRLVFRNVYDSLRDDGFFVFDLLLEAVYGSGQYGSGFVEDDLVGVVRIGDSKRRHVVNLLVTIFQRGKGWKRTDVMLEQRIHSSDAVAQTLEAVGFKDIRIHRYRRGGSRSWLHRIRGRAFYECRKPSSKG